jgi:lipopolysaccharide transport system ATP-binding protein
MRDAAISYQIFNSKDIAVLHVLNLNSENSFGKERGQYCLSSIIPKLRLYPDQYYLKIHLADNFYKKKYETIDKVCFFEIKYFGSKRDYYWYDEHAIYVEETIWGIKKL